MRPDSRDSRDSYNEERHREKPRAKKEDSPPTKKIEEKEVVQPKKDIVNSWKSEEFTRSWADDDPYEEEIEKLSEPIMEEPERPDEKSSRSSVEKKISPKEDDYKSRNEEESSTRKRPESKSEDSWGVDKSYRKNDSSRDFERKDSFSHNKDRRKESKFQRGDSYERNENSSDTLWQDSGVQVNKMLIFNLK